MFFERAEQANGSVKTPAVTGSPEMFSQSVYTERRGISLFGIITHVALGIKAPHYTSEFRVDEMVDEISGSTVRCLTVRLKTILTESPGKSPDYPRVQDGALVRVGIRAAIHSDRAVEPSLRISCPLCPEWQDIACQVSLHFTLEKVYFLSGLRIKAGGNHSQHKN